MEDKPRGFIFLDHWITRSLSIIDLNHQTFSNLQDYINFGVATKKMLALDKLTPKHLEYLSQPENQECQENASIQCVRYTGLITPGKLVAFRINRKSVSSDHYFSYSEEIVINSVPYILQSVIAMDENAKEDSQDSPKYHTVTKTEHPSEPWLDCSGTKVTVVSKEAALSHQTNAVVLIYSVAPEYKKVENSKARASRKTNLGTACIERDPDGYAFVRYAALQATHFSKHFKLDDTDEFILGCIQKGYDKQIVRQALAYHVSHPSRALDEHLCDIEKEQSVLTRDLYKIGFPKRLDDTKAVLQEKNVSLEASFVLLSTESADAKTEHKK